MANRPRWRIRLEKELAFQSEFTELNEDDWRSLLKSRSVTSSNHDTVLALDWPHYCSHATRACGGATGWCYTFQGNQAGMLHNRHAAMVDVLARKYPCLFAEIVAEEVFYQVRKGNLPYPNLRYSGSGEVVESYFPALQKLVGREVTLWGFTRSLRIAEGLRDLGASVIISCDSTSPSTLAAQAASAGFAIAYTSMGVNDAPPEGTVVTFPIHRIGRVREVVDSPTVCPKVLADFFEDSRPKAGCQVLCRRCHIPKVEF